MQMGSRGVERASVPKLNLGEQTCLLLFFRLLSSLLLNHKFVHPFSSRRRPKGPDRARPSNRAALGGDIGGTRYVRQKLICMCILFAIVRHLITKMPLFFSFHGGGRQRWARGRGAKPSASRPSGVRGRSCFSIAVYDGIDNDVARVKGSLVLAKA